MTYEDERMQSYGLEARKGITIAESDKKKGCPISRVVPFVNPLNAEFNPICHLLALLGGATIVVVSRLRVHKYWNTNV